MALTNEREGGRERERNREKKKRKAKLTFNTGTGSTVSFCVQLTQKVTKNQDQSNSCKYT